MSRAAPTLEPSITVTKRTDRSIYMWILQKILRPFNVRISKPKIACPPGSPRLSGFHAAAKRCDVQERVAEGIYIYDLVPKQKASKINEEHGSKRRRLYYFAGGSWQSPPSRDHWAFLVEMARKLPNTVVSVVSCPLAPESTAPDAFPELVKMLKRLLHDADEAQEEVIIAGDSSGANIIICLTTAYLAGDDSEHIPTAVMAICPSTNPRNDNPEAREVEKRDPILRIATSTDYVTKWRGKWDASDPRVSPITADVSLFARRGIALHGLTAGYDILSPDAVLFRERCAKAGVKGKWLEWDKQMHCFPLAFSYKFPESVEAKNWILEVLSRA